MPATSAGMTPGSVVSTFAYILSAAWPRTLAIALQGIHECNEIEPLSLGQLNGNQHGRPARAIDAALLIMPHDIGQGSNRGIVHVRRTQRHRSQRRRLESKAQRSIL